MPISSKGGESDFFRTSREAEKNCCWSWSLWKSSQFTGFDRILHLKTSKRNNLIFKRTKNGFLKIKKKKVLQKNSTIMRRSHKFLNIHSFLNMILIWLIELLINDFYCENWHCWTFFGKFNISVYPSEASKLIIRPKLTTKMHLSRDRTFLWEINFNFCFLPLWTSACIYCGL